MLAANLWIGGKPIARPVLGDMGQGLSPFPYALIFPQDEHEQLLIDRLAQAGVEVERQTELQSFEDLGDRARARLKRLDGAASHSVEQDCEAAYIAGCDGAHSTVRESLGIGFPGGTYNHLFYVADVEAGGPVMNGELHVGLDTAEFLVVFPLKQDDRARLIGTITEEVEHRDQLNEPEKKLSWEDVSKQVVKWMSIDVRRVNWFSTYRVYHRVADHFRGASGRKRAFLLGDAAHIHSPVGGQGMNTGIGDAVNLAWKLAAVLLGRAPESLLDSYEPERIAFAHRLVATTDQAFTGITSDGPIARFIRLKLVPLLLPALFRVQAFRRLMFLTISQTAINYRGSSLSEGRAGQIQGGDRLPWAKGAAPLGASGGAIEDNFAPLQSLDWQVHVYGDAPAELQTACFERNLPLHIFPWRPEMDAAGLKRNAIYLVRPDGYVALANSEGRAPELLAYLDLRKLAPMR